MTDVQVTDSTALTTPITPTLSPNVTEYKVLTKTERDKEFREELNRIEKETLAKMAKPVEVVENNNTADEVAHVEPPKEVSNSGDEDSPNSSVEQALDSSGADIDDDGRDLDNKPIPKKRLDKEVSKRRELEQKLQEEREARIKYETELNIYNEAIKKLNKQPDPKEVDIDPIDNEAHQLYMNKIRDLEKRLEDTTSNLMQNNQQLRYENTLTRQAEEFTKKQPDFKDAYSYIVDKEVETARLIGIPENQISSFVDQKLAPIAHKIYSDGGNVAETIYKMAKSYGYTSNAGKDAPRKNGVNLRAIEKNAQKSTSIIDDIPAVAVTASGTDASGATAMNRFNEIMDKAGENKDKVFRELIEKMKRG